MLNFQGVLKMVCAAILQEDSNMIESKPKI